MDRIKEKIRERVLQQVPTGVDVDEKYLADAIDRVITEIGQEQYMRFGDRKKMRREIFNSMRKLDVLQELIETDEITEIMINGPDHIFVEKEGQLYETGLTFESVERLEDIAQQIASEGNRIVNGKAQLLPQELDAVEVVAAADAGDRVCAADFSRKHARENVRLVVRRDSDQKIALRHERSVLHVERGAVSLHGHTV